MATSEHTFPIPEIEAHKLDIAQHELEATAPAQETSPVTGFLQANKWSLVIFGTLGLAIGFALRRK